jgi:hypothetical protein
LKKKHKKIELTLVVCAGIGPCVDYEQQPSLLLGYHSRFKVEARPCDVVWEHQHGKPKKTNYLP